MKYSLLSTILLTSSGCFAHLIQKNEASNVISNPMNGMIRSRRANKKFGSLEENFRKSDLDRECASEDCGQEEYDEIFENYVNNYRDLDDYRNALFGAYTKCKVTGIALDVTEMGDCIKAEYGKMPSKQLNYPSEHQPPSKKQTFLAIDSIIN